MKRLLLLMPLLLLAADTPQEIDGWKVISGEWKPSKEKAWQTDSGSLKFEGDTAQAGSIRLTANLYILRWKPDERCYIFILWGNPKQCVWISDNALRVGVWGGRGENYKGTPWLAPLKKRIAITLQMDCKGITGSVGGQKVVGDAALDSVLPMEIRVAGAEVAISDLSTRVLEARHLDTPDVKEEKTAEAKDEKPDETKPAEAEKLKEEKASVELGNALGKDADGNPIVWDISPKGALRSADAKGKLTKITLYGPGQMTARIKAQTLVLMGNGEAEITAGGATQTVTLPGKADIKGGDIITLKAKRGTVQITDITAEGKP